jgi:serine phosphatase RsbU (regulator of sigma subunit)
MKRLYLATGLLILATGLFAQPTETLVLPESSSERPYTRISEGWRFTPDDDPSFALPGFDDSRWAETSIPMRPGTELAAWDGRGWFRTRVILPDDAGLLAIRISQGGASEVFFDGRRIATVGEIREDGIRPETLINGIVFDPLSGGEHVIAVRYASPEWRKYEDLGRRAGPRVYLARAQPGVEADVRDANRTAGYLWLFTGVFLAFATLHVLLYAFSPEIRVNLDFALLCVNLAAMAWFLFVKGQMTDPRMLLYSEPIMNIGGIGMAWFAMRFVHGIFLDRTPVTQSLMLIAGVPVAIWSLFEAGEAVVVVFLLMLLSSVEMIRVTAIAFWQGLPGSRLIGTGILLFGGGFLVGLLSLLGILPTEATYSTLVPFFSVIALLVSMSLYVSRQFAMTNQQLREKLVEVQVLSEQTLEHERRAQAEEYERKLIEAEYSRQVTELEEARQLQLSMLPSSLPAHSDLEIAAHMETATEVGGDYYDFEIDEDGSLTIAVGDATGHGMRAGTMVTATKSLFGVFGTQHDLTDTMHRSTRALKRMNLRKLAMALTLARYDSGTLHISSAGMPPVMIHRGGTGAVDQVELPGMPLGSLADFPYGERSVSIEPGDTVLFMSDGFPERLNLRDEMLGYENAAEAFRQAAGRSPAEVVEALNEVAERWAAGRPLDDDLTFVVVKRREN